MNQELKNAIKLRSSGKHDEALSIIQKLLGKQPSDPLANYHCAWTYDNMGKEKEAVFHYVSALENGLSGEDRKHTYIGLGSTYRALGEYEKSKKTLKKGLKEFPDCITLKVFLSMALYNLKDHSQSMKLLLKELLNTTKDKELLSYRKALEFYSDKLDQKW